MQIVIVDDNRGNLLLFSHLVSSLGDHEPITFSDSSEALEWCTGHEPDLILVDYMMPGLDGLEFISLFRDFNGHADIPIIMITTADLREVRNEALGRGATDFLSKPVDATEFAARVNNLLALRRSQLRLRDRAEWLADEVSKATSELIQRENEVIFRLSKATEYRDPETGQHIRRMAYFSRLIGIGIELPDEELDLIFRAAPMHDIGKVGISDDILLKSGRLTPDEFEIMKEHSTIGHAILKDSPSKLLQKAAEIALSHHEHFDGNGYPSGLVGEDIPLVGRIVAVADVFDALSSERPYKKAWPIDESRELIVVESGKHFDPAVVQGFLGMFDPILKIRDRYGE